MSRASAARIQRVLQNKERRKKMKKALKNNQCWDELQLLHGAALGLLATAGKITPILKNKDLVDKMGEQHVLVIANTINRDLEYYVGKVAEVFSKHKDLTGGSHQEDDLIAAIGISQEYMEVTNSFNTVVGPNIEMILNMANIAADILDKERQTIQEAVVETPEAVTETVEGKSDESQ